MTADELLEQMETTPLSVESNEKCIIDPETREIEVPLTYQLLGVESDEKVERIEFQCPRIVGDSIELSELQIRINFRNANQETDQYIVEDVMTDGENITFSWLLSRKVTAYQGTVSFIVCAVKISGDSITNEWNTTLAESEVLEGLEVDTPSPSGEQSDVIAQLLQIMKDTSDQAVEAVESAEATAKQAIEDYTEQMKATIPGDYTEMVKKVDVLERTKAPAIYQTVSGESLQIEDSADAPMAGLRVFGKSRQVKTTGAQLFDASKLPTKTQGGATVTNNGDGSFTISGSGNLTDDFGGVNYSINSDDFKKLFKVGNVYLKGAINKGIYFEVAYIKSDGNLYQRNDQTINLTNEIYNAITSVKIGFYGNSGSAIPNETIKPMLYQDGDGTWEPYTGGEPSPSSDYTQEIEIPGSEGSVEVGLYGANLININLLNVYKKCAEVEIEGSVIKFTPTLDGDSYMGYINTRESKVWQYDKNLLISVNGISEVGFLVSNPYFLNNYAQFYNHDYMSMNFLNLRSSSGKIQIPEDAAYMSFRIGNANAKLSDGTQETTVMIYNSVYSGEFEPYKEPQHLTITTPNGLPGIPVDSGGNYTDESGQQWICDEIDLERGKYVQRVKKVTNLTFTKTRFGGELEDSNLYATSSISDMYATNNYPPAICSNLIYDKNVLATEMDAFYIYDKTIRARLKGIKDDEVAAATLKTYTFIYPLATPIETDLSEEELTAYAALRTNYPTTVVTSDSDPEVGIEVEYVADTQKYIDNKFAELAQNLAATQNTLLEV